jgi:hypothetical protein
VKAKLFVLLIVTAALAVPALALADDAPAPAATACTAEYVQLGADAFKAKYGATEPYAACLKAHGITSTPPTTQKPPANGPEAACKAEYMQLGADAFKAKYGATDGIGACVKLHQGATQNSTDKSKTDKSTKAGGTVSTIAQALCTAEGQSLGKDAFQAKYGAGKAGLAACVKAAQAKAQSIFVACKSGASTNGDAFKQCVNAALKSARVHLEPVSARARETPSAAAGRRGASRAGGGTRTHDRPITNRVLYQLSYSGESRIVGEPRRTRAELRGPSGA